LLVEVRDGRDPAGERRQRASTPIFSELAARYLKDHAEAKKNPRSVAEDRRLLDRHVLPVLGSRKLSAVTSGDIDRLHTSLTSTPTSGNPTLRALER
jgi:hypothetical protein